MAASRADRLVTTGHRRLPLLERLDRDRVLALAGEWDHLVADSPSGSPFLTWPWIGAWLETLGREADLEVVTARDPMDGRLLGVAPFFVEPRRRAGVAYRSLRVIGNGPAAPDHLDMPIRSDHVEQIAPMLWEAVGLNRRWDVIDLDGVAAGGSLARVALRRRDDTGKVETIPCPFLSLDGGWDTVEARMGRSHRQNIGRYSRKLDADAQGVNERLVVSERDLEQTMIRLGEMHQLIRVGHGERGAFADAHLVALHREVARRMLRAGRLRLWRLDADGKTIAAILCFRYGDTVSFYTTGFDPAWSAYGPGRRIMATAIRGAIAEGATEFDFLRGDETYKQAWGVETRTDIRIRRSVGAKGRLLWMGRRAALPFSGRAERSRS